MHKKAEAFTLLLCYWAKLFLIELLSSIAQLRFT